MLSKTIFSCTSVSNGGCREGKEQGWVTLGIPGLVLSLLKQVFNSLWPVSQIQVMVLSFGPQGTVGPCMLDQVPDPSTQGQHWGPILAWGSVRPADWPCITHLVCGTKRLITSALNWPLPQLSEMGHWARWTIGLTPYGTYILNRSDIQGNKYQFQ